MAGAPAGQVPTGPCGDRAQARHLAGAARRELAEETGARNVRYLGRTDGWLAYDFPPEHTGTKAMRGWKGQKQVWFAFRFDGKDAELPA